MAIPRTEVTAYHDFSIEIGHIGASDGPGPIVRLTPAEARPVEIPFRLTIEPRLVEEAIASVGQLADRSVKRSSPLETLDAVKDLGIRLYETVFAGRLGSTFERTLSAEAANNHGLRLTLSAEDPAHLALPWEYLFDPNRKDFVALSMHSVLTRRIFNLPLRPPLEPLPDRVRLLVVTADLFGNFGVEPEVKIFRDLADTYPQLDLQVVENADVVTFFEALTTIKPDLLHFIGTAVETSQIDAAGRRQQLLIMMDRNRQPRAADGPVRPEQHLSITQLKDALSQQPQLRLVCLSACHSDGLAEQLMTAVPAAIGMRNLVMEQTCWAFSRELYQRLLEHDLIEEAVTRARRNVDYELPGGRGWGIPVFYLQVPAGVVLSTPHVQSESNGLPQQPPAPSVVVARPVITPGVSNETFGGYASGAGRKTTEDREIAVVTAQLKVHQLNLDALTAASTTSPPEGLLADQIQSTRETIRALEERLATLNAKSPEAGATRSASKRGH